MYNSIADVVFSNLSATPASFTLRSGNYSVTAIAAWGGGSVTLQRLAADGSTYVPALPAFSTNGMANTYLPSGTYKLAIATATAVYVDIVSIEIYH